MIKLFEQFNNEQEIHDICKEYKIENYTINPDGSIDVDGIVKLLYMGLEKLPLKFNRVSGDFICSRNRLTSLVGSPKYVGGFFDCANNQLDNLEGSPKEVGQGFYCQYNKLTSLKGCSEFIGGGFYCQTNNLSTLEGIPLKLGSTLNCHSNNIITLNGFPVYIKGNLLLGNNPISIVDTSIEVIDGRIHIENTEFSDIIKDLDDDKMKILFEHGVDYDIFDKNGTFHVNRLERMFKDFNI